MSDALLKKVMQSKIAFSIAKGWADGYRGKHNSVSDLTNCAGFRDKSLPVERSESLTISSKPKTAALCFDRVWGANLDIPESIRYWGATSIESVAAHFIISLQRSHHGGLYKSFIPQKILAEYKQQIQPENIANLKPAELEKMYSELSMAGIKNDQGLAKVFVDCAKELFTDVVNQSEESAASDINEHILKQSITRIQQLAVIHACKRVVTPIYESEFDFNNEYKAGERNILLGILHDISLVDEENLHWEQVIEFRKDHESNISYKRFVLWLDTDCVGKSEEYIHNAICVKLSDYEESLKKHGIRTAQGVLTTVIDEKTLISSAAGAISVAQIAADPFLAATAAVLPIFGRTLLEISKAKLSMDGIVRGKNSEIAFVHEVKALTK